jgi:ubiquinone biosynthesis protein UbiJ
MNGEEAVVTVVFFAGVFVVLRPLAAALAKRIGGEARASRPPEVDEAVHSELERLREDVDQLAERVDFAERLLSKQRETPRVGPGG